MESFAYGLLPFVSCTYWDIASLFLLFFAYVLAKATVCLDDSTPAIHCMASMRFGMTASPQATQIISQIGVLLVDQKVSTSADAKASVEAIIVPFSTFFASFARSRSARDCSIKYDIVFVRNVLNLFAVEGPHSCQRAIAERHSYRNETKRVKGISPSVPVILPASVIDASSACRPAICANELLGMSTAMRYTPRWCAMVFR